MFADIIFSLYIILLIAYAYMCYGKYGWNYWIYERDSNKDG